MNYDDIIRLPHHVSKTRPRMSRSDRAAQFAPFAALVGYGAAVAETARETDARREPEDDGLALLNRQLAYLADRIREAPEITVTYFVPDDRKSGGAYVTVTGTVRKLAPDRSTLLLRDGPRIPVADIAALSGPFFDAL